MHPDESQFLPSDLERLTAETFIQSVQYHQEIGSTNDCVLELLRASSPRLPLLVLAESQTAGRGRGQNRWWAGRGALTFSLVLDTKEMQLPTIRWPQVSLTVGLAVCEALEEFLGESGLEVALKWPNDVYVQGRKISGILVESVSEPGGGLLIGIGMNVNNPRGDAPEELQATVISLCELLGRKENLTNVLVMVLRKLAERLPGSEFWNEQVRAAWRKRCMLTDRTIQVEQMGQLQTGLCRGIDDQGALVLETPQGPVQCWSGVVSF